MWMRLEEGEEKREERGGEGEEGGERREERGGEGEEEGERRDGRGEMMRGEIRREGEGGEGKLLDPWQDSSLLTNQYHEH